MLKKMFFLLTDLMEDELKDAEHYAMLAEKHMHDFPRCAKLFTDLSSQELGHFGLLRDELVLMVGDYKDRYGEPHEIMRAWHELNAKYSEKENRIRYMLSKQEKTEA